MADSANVVARPPAPATHRKILAPRPPRSGSSPGLPLPLSSQHQSQNRKQGENGADRSLRKPTDTSTGRRRSSKPRLVACQSCRRAKLRCEDSGEGTRPCQRCRELSQPCKVEANYKRSSRRIGTAPSLFNPPRYPAEQRPPEPADLLSIDFEADQALEHSDQTAFIDFPPSARGQGTTPGHAPSSPRQLSVSLDHPTLQDPDRRASTAGERGSSQSHVQYHHTAQNARTIGMVTLEPAQIQYYFAVFFSCYHPCLPVVMPPASADAVYDMSPFLFWTIIMTAARHDETDLSLFQSLSPNVRTLLWSTIANPPHILPSLQAMCILCAWAFPASSMSQDITFIVSGVLKAAALHAGLYQPDAYAHFSRSRYSLSPDELREAARVWCCIYVTIENLATTAGHLPYIPTDRVVEHASTASNPYNLPPSLHQAIVVQMFCNKVHSAMGELDRLEASASRPKRASSLRLLEADFQELERRLGPSTSRSHRVNLDLLSAAFQLRGYWLLEPQESSLRRENIIRAYDNVLDLVTQMEVGDKSELPLKHASWWVYMVSIAGAIYISKVMHSSYRPYVDAERGKQTFNTCLYILRQCSVQDNDLPGRCNRLLTQIWNIHRGQASEDGGGGEGGVEVGGALQRPPGLKIASRMFFSIVYDSLWLWREKYGGQPANGAPGLPPPFIPASPSVSISASAPPPPLLPQPPSPPISAAHSTLQLPGTVESPVPGMPSFMHDVDLHDDCAGDLAANEDFTSLWDIGFFNPNAANFGLPLSDFGVNAAENTWL